MSVESSTPHLDNLDEDSRQRIAALCARLENEWREGSEPTLAEFLQGFVGDVRRALLIELLRRDMQHRRSRERRPLFDVYKELLPTDTDTVASFFQQVPTIDSSLESESSDPTDEVPDSEQRGPPPSVPQKIGQYVVGEPLGEGGFGRVFRARDPLLERDVAIKTPQPGKEGNRQVAAFLNEARAVAKLDRHPNIVHVLEIVEIEGRYFIVFDLIEGATLQEKLRTHKYTPHEAVALVATVAEALQFVHENDYVHRDVKPANILLDRLGTPYLTDFGLAASTADQDSEGFGLRGTVGYMSPEQAQGKSNFAREGADVFALGVVLYELLVGERPFRGPDRKTILSKIRHQQPKAPRLVDPTLPEALEEVCLKCLRKNPEDRFQTAGQVALALRGAMTPRTPWVFSATAAIGVVIVALAVALALAWSPDSQPPRPPQPNSYFDTRALGRAVPRSVDLLDWRPNLRFFPSEHSVNWVPRKPISVQCPRFGLVEFAANVAPPFTFRVVFLPNVGNGSIGWYWGFADGFLDGGRSCVRAQVLRIIPRRAGGATLDWYLAEDTNPSKPTLQGFGPPFGLVRTSLPERCTLEIRVEKGGRRHVSWCGKSYPTLVPAQMSERLTAKHPKPDSGRFGLQLINASVVINEMSLDFE